MRVQLLTTSLLLASVALAGCGGGSGDGSSPAPSASDAGAGSSAATAPGETGAAVGGGAAAGTEQAQTAPEPEPSDVRYVSPEGDDGADGSEATPWATVAHAVASVGPGTKIVVRGGTWPGLEIAAVDGTEEAPIVLAGEEGNRPIFTGPVKVSRAYWILDGIEVASTEPVFSVRFTGAGSHDNVLRNSVVRDGTGAAGVSIDLDASRILVEGNEIFNISRGETDAHGVVVQPTTREVRVVGNEIHGTSGDSVQCIGPGQDAVEGAPANGVVIEGNTFYDTRENAVDIKHCENVEIRGNVMHGFRVSSTSNGEAIVVHLLASNVKVEENDISNTSRGVVTGRGATNVVVRRNVIHDMADEMTAILFGEGSGFSAVHNTIVGAATGVQALAGSGMPAVRNNIFESVGAAVNGEAAVDTNLFSRTAATGENPVEGEAALDGENVPADGSAAIDNAAPVEEEPACGAGPDFGAIERC